MASRISRPRILVPDTSLLRFHAPVSRRGFLGGIGATLLGGVALAACGDTTIYVEQPRNTLVDRRLRMYSWDDYDDPDVLAAWGDVDVVTYSSNEELIAQLVAAKGMSGFDVVQPTGPYVPELVREGLIQQLDLMKIPNFRFLSPEVTDQEWDRGNAYSVCKSWGTFGWLYDSAVVTEQINSWADFVTAAKGSASGKTVLADTGVEIASLYFWYQDRDWRKLSESDLSGIEIFLLEEIAPHLAAVDSLPYNSIVSQEYALIQGYSGSLRSCMLALDEAGIDTSTWRWSPGSPVTQKYIDNFCIVKGARHEDAAYDYINFMLSPINAARSSLYLGADTGVVGLDQLRPPETEYPEFFTYTAAELGRMQHWRLTGHEVQLAEIRDKLVAKVQGSGLVKG